jgi:hypothetical protein
MSNNKKNFASLRTWLEDSGLELFLLGQDFTKLIFWQLAYYKMFFPQLNIDCENISIDYSRLNLIAQGLKRGLVNYPLLICSPSKIVADEQNWSEAQYFYHHLFLPLTNGGRSIFGNPIQLSIKSSDSLYSEFNQAECVANYTPVALEDFDLEKFQIEPEQEMLRIVNEKKSISQVVPGKTELIFTNASLESYGGQKVLNKNGEMVETDGSFQSIIAKQIKILSPAAAIILFSQMYYVDHILPNKQRWEWLMGIVHNPVAGKEHCLSAAGVSLGSDIKWSSYDPRVDGAGTNFRLAL